MTAAQLRFLRIFLLQILPDGIKQLHITLLRILLEGRDERPTHRPRRLAANIRIGTSLRILTATPHDNIGRTRLRPSCLLQTLIALCSLFEETHGCRSHAADIAAGVGGYEAEEALAGFFGQVGFFEDALGGVDVGEVEGGAGVAGVEDCGQADAGGEGHDEDAVHFVVDDVAGLAEVDGVDDFVVAVIFVAVEIFGLAAVACTTRRDQVSDGIVGAGVAYMKLD